MYLRRGVFLLICSFLYTCGAIEQRTESEIDYISDWDIKPDSIVIANRYYASGEFSKTVPVKRDTVFYFSDSLESAKLNVGEKWLIVNKGDSTYNYEYMDDSLVSKSVQWEGHEVKNYSDHSWIIKKKTDHIEIYIFGVYEDTLVWTTTIDQITKESSNSIVVNNFNGDTLYKNIISNESKTNYLYDFSDSSIVVTSIVDDQNIDKYYFFSQDVKNMEVQDIDLRKANRVEHEKIIRQIKVVNNIKEIIIEHYFF